MIGIGRQQYYSPVTCWLKRRIKRQNVTIQTCDSIVSDVWSCARHYKVWETKTGQEWLVVTALCGEERLHEAGAKHDGVREKYRRRLPHNRPLQVPGYRVSIQSSWYQNFESGKIRFGNFSLASKLNNFSRGFIFLFIRYSASDNLFQYCNRWCEDKSLKLNFPEQRQSS